MTYPTVQNFPTTFQSDLSCLTPSTGDDSTLVATTEWFNLFFTARKILASITWTGLQNFATLLTSTIAGDTEIGNAAANNIEVATTASRSAVLSLGTGAGSTGSIDIGNGVGSTHNVQILYSATNNSTGVVNLGNSTSTLNLRSPLTPLYSYNAIPFNLTNGTYTYGTAGKIGYTTIQYADRAGYINGTPNGDTFWRDIFTVSLTQGVWLLAGEFQSDGANDSKTGIGFNTTTNTNVGGFGLRGTLRGQFPPPTGTPYFQVSTSAVYYASGTVTIRLLGATGGYGFYPGKVYFTAMRLA